MLRKKEAWKSETLAMFSQQLHSLLASGIPLTASLELLADQNVISDRVGKGLLQSLNQGASLSQALAQQAFPDLFISFIRAAEEHGDYVFGLQQCEAYYRARAKLVQELLQACTYPLIVLGCVGFALVFMVTFVLPRFAELYQTLGVELPAITRYMLALGEWAQLFTWLIIGLLLLILLLWLVMRWGAATMRPHLERWLLAVPFISAYYRYRMTHYVAIQLGSLLKSGVPLLTSLKLMERLSPWFVLAQAIARTKERIVTGLPLHQSLH
jgi:type II secretory pathway component PulF